MVKARKNTQLKNNLENLTEKDLKLWFFQPKEKFFSENLTATLALTFSKEQLAEKDLILKRANRLLEDCMIFDEEWDMERCPTPYLLTFPINWEESRNGDPEWMWMLNRQKYLITLAKAYVLTKDLRYFEKWQQLILDWLDYHQKPFPNYRPTTSRTLDTGMRLRNWCFCLDLFRQCPELKTVLAPEVLEKIIASMLTQMDYLETVRLSDQTPISNWKVLEMNGVALTSLFFRTLLDTLDDLAYALEVLQEALTIQFNEDGLHWEQSFMYHCDIFMCGLEVHETLQRHQLASPFKPILEKILPATLAFVKPNGKQSPVGDSDEEDLRSLVTYAALTLESGEAKKLGEQEISLETLFHYGYSALEKNQTLLAKDRSENFLPLLNSGYVFSHDISQEEEIFTMFKASPQGGGHGHEDFGHFDIHVAEDYLLSDSGRFTYLEGSAERVAFKAAPAHNTTTVDEKEYTIQTGSWSFGPVAHTLPVYAKKIGDKAFVEATHLGYFTGEDHVLTQRKIYYLAPDLWLLVDHFLTHETHTYQQYFNFPTENLTATFHNSFTYNGGSHALHLNFLADSTSQKEILAAQHSSDYNERHASSRLKISSNEVVNPVLISLQKEATFKEVPVTHLGGKEISKAFVTAYQIESPTFSGYVIDNHLEDQSSSSRKSYTVAGCDVFGRAVVLDKKDLKSPYQFKG